MIHLRNTCLGLALVSFWIFPGEARNRDRVKWLVPTRTGSTGLLTLPLAENLRPGELAGGLHGIHFHRLPGDLDLTIFTTTLTAGIHERVELFVSWEGQRRVHADGILIHRIGPGEPLAPARLLQPGTGSSFFNDTPFLDRGFSSGPGELAGGIKLNLLSQARGQPFGLALQPVWKLPLSESRSRLLGGLTNGAAEAGYDLILTRNLDGGATLAGRSGFRFTGRSRGLRLQHRFNYGAGLELPLASPRVRLLGELVGSAFFGPAPPLANPVSPVDLHLGLRLFASPGVALSVAYGNSLRSGDPSPGRADANPGSGSGWTVQLSLQRRINRLPTIRCSPRQSWIRAGEGVAIQVSISDPDDSKLSLTWRTTRGRILGRGTTAVFDSTGLDPGDYRISAEVSDGSGSAACSARVTVEPAPDSGGAGE